MLDLNINDLISLNHFVILPFNCLCFLNRSRPLRRLEVACCRGRFYNIWSKALKKFPFLVELSLFEIILSGKAIETVGRYCPLLKILKVNKKADKLLHEQLIDNEIAITIGKNLPELTHLELIGNNLSCIGLKAILDGCLQLESLDFRQCFYLKGGIRKICSNKITYLKLPNDSLEGCPYISENNTMSAFGALDAYRMSDASGAFDADDASDDEYPDYFDLRIRRLSL